MEKTGALEKTMRKNHRKKYLKEKVFIWAIWTVPFLIFLVYQVGTSIETLTLAFKEYDTTTGEFFWVGFETFENAFNSLFGDQLIFNGLKNSIVIWCVNTFIMLPIQLLVSYSVYKKVFGAGSFKVILFLPQIISGMIWMLIFTYAVDYILPLVTGKALSAFSNNSMNFGVLMIYGIWLGFASNLIIYTGAMSRIPQNIVESGKLDGMGYLREFVYITLPLIFPTLSVILITIISGVFLSGLSLFPFYGTSAPEHLYSIPYYIYVMVAGKVDNPVKFPMNSALSLIIACVTIPTTLLMRHLCEKYGPSVEY